MNYANGSNSQIQPYYPFQYQHFEQRINSTYFLVKIFPNTGDSIVPSNISRHILLADRKSTPIMTGVINSETTINS